MKEILLTQGKVALIDDEDYELVMKHKWYAYHHRKDLWYANTNVSLANGRRSTLQMHRLILGFPPSLVDHRDQNGLNNQRLNLRVATRTQNQHNRRLSRHNAQGFKGVSKNHDRFMARIIVEKCPLYLGTFDCAEEAAKVYDEAAVRFFGQFARTNQNLGLL